MFSNSMTPSFKGVKYYNYNKDVINSYFNYRMKCDGTSVSKVKKILDKQSDNPNHIIIDYKAIDGGHSVSESATVNGKKFERRKFESVYHMLKRAANYADSLRGKDVAPIENADRLSDFLVNA